MKKLIVLILVTYAAAFAVIRAQAQVQTTTAYGRSLLADTNFMSVSNGVSASKAYVNRTFAQANPSNIMTMGQITVGTFNYSNLYAMNIIGTNLGVTFVATNTIATWWIHQGIVTDQTNFYLLHTTALYKTTTNLVGLLTNASPFSGLTGTNVLNHFGDGEFYNGKVYAVAEHYTSCSQFSNQNIVVYNATTLVRETNYNISAQTNEVSGLTIVPDITGTGGTIITIDYCSGQWFNLYDVRTFEYLGKITLSTALPFSQGIKYHKGRFYITVGNQLWQSDFNGRTRHVATLNSVGGLEGLDFLADELWVLEDVSGGVGTSLLKTYLIGETNILTLRNDGQMLIDDALYIYGGSIDGAATKAAIRANDGSGSLNLSARFGNISLNFDKGTNGVEFGNGTGASVIAKVNRDGDITASGKIGFTAVDSTTPYPMTFEKGFKTNTALGIEVLSSTTETNMAFNPGTNISLSLFQLGTNGTPLHLALATNATLDFANAAAGNMEDLTTPLVGITDNGNWSVTVTPAAAVMAGTGMNTVGVSFKAWISADNTITVRFCNLNSATAVDPPSGLFSILATKTAAD